MKLARFDWDPEYIEFYHADNGGTHLFGYIKGKEGNLTVKVYRHKLRTMKSVKEAIAFIEEKHGAYAVAKRLG